MASKRPVRLTSEQVLAAILNSDNDESDVDSVSDGFSSEESCLEDAIDEDGNEIDLSSLPVFGQHCVPDPCDRDSLLIGNVSTYLFLWSFATPIANVGKQFLSDCSITVPVQLL